MAKRTPSEQLPSEAVQIKFHCPSGLLEWLESESEVRDRSKAYLIIEALEDRRKRLLRRRKT